MTEIRKQDNPDFNSALQFAIDLDERQARELPRPLSPGRKHVIPPIFPLCFIDGVLYETGHLLIVFKPDEHILHDEGIAGNPPDVGEVVMGQIIKDQSLCCKGKNHAAHHGYIVAGIFHPEPLKQIPDRGDLPGKW
jgi:hypothetical protein